MTHAIVIGGSMAGMCAARVLSAHYDRVTILDKDTYPDTATHRIGVPQSHHAHALLARGKRELERLFPGFEKSLLERGALLFDYTERFAIMRMWGWAPRCTSGLKTLWASRPLLEAVVREKLRTTRGVELRENITVESLLLDPTNRRRVTGVKAKPKGSPLEDIFADLVVDASGRGSKAPKWFDALGIASPREDIVEAYAGYASRFYRWPSRERRPKDWWWDGLWIEGAPPDFPHGGVAFPVENDLWLVTAVGFCKEYPPTDEAGFLKFLEALASPILARVLEHCEPVSDIVPTRSTTNRFRHYETWQDALDGFLAVGDSVSAFNPVYGQGMSTASVCATVLEKALQKVGPSARELPKLHFAEQARFLSGIWNLTTGADFTWPMTEGKRPPGSKLFQPYFTLMMESMHCDPAVLRKMVPILHLLEDPSRAIAPDIVAAVVKSTIRRRLRGLRAPAAVRGTVPPEMELLSTLEA